MSIKILVFSDTAVQSEDDRSNDICIEEEYERMLPMDIYPQHLMKAIITNDYERMEGLGIHELAEEDVALCEFVCTSKQPLQSILKQGLDAMREQG